MKKISILTNVVLGTLLLNTAVAQSGLNQQTLQTTGKFNTASCTTQGETKHCIAAGQDQTSSAPLLVQNTEGRNHWEVLDNISNLPPYGNFFASSCTPLQETTQCIAAGLEYANNDSPLLTQSIDGGNSWEVVKDIGNLPTGGIFYAASCVDYQQTSHCTAAGRDYVSGAPLLIQSVNGGNTWAAVTHIPELPTSGIFYASSCTESDNTTQCVVTGEDFTSNVPLFVQSIDSGKNWAMVNDI